MYFIYKPELQFWKSRVKISFPFSFKKLSQSIKEKRNINSKFR